VNFAGTILVCLQGSGSMVYMDATQAPRLPVVLTNATSSGGYTCVNIGNAGTLVLVESRGDLPGGLAPGRGGGVGLTQSLSGCQVTTNLRLNLRSVPGLDGAVLAIVPEGLTFEVGRRTRRWFQISFEGRIGWIAAGYVTPNGQCDY
jgi:uncharacterized protein YgiM (DUF1202 family)